LESALDIREIIRNTMKDQLTIYPNYKVAVVGQVFFYKGKETERESK
jgi:hypothetical protein